MVKFQLSYVSSCLFVFGSSLDFSLSHSLEFHDNDRIVSTYIYAFKYICIHTPIEKKKQSPPSEAVSHVASLFVSQYKNSNYYFVLSFFLSHEVYSVQVEHYFFSLLRTGPNFSLFFISPLFYILIALSQLNFFLSLLLLSCVNDTSSIFVRYHPSTKQMSLVLSLWTTRAKEKHKETFEFEEEKTREIVYFDRNTLRKKNIILWASKKKKTEHI